MLFKSKKSEPQEVIGAALEDECRDLSDDVLDTIYGGQGSEMGSSIEDPSFSPVKFCQTCEMPLSSTDTNCGFCGAPVAIYEAPMTPR